MKVYHISAPDMCKFGVFPNVFRQHKAVRSVILDKAICAYTDEWQLFFVMESSWRDIDDDKTSYYSPK